MILIYINEFDLFIINNSNANINDYYKNGFITQEECIIINSFSGIFSSCA